MTGRVHDVDFNPLVRYGDVFRQNGNPAFPFEVVGVQNLVAFQLFFSHLAALAENAVDKRRLPVVNVGDNGDISQVFALF